MIQETSPTAHIEAFVRPLMPQHKVIELIRNVWAAAYAKGFSDSDRAHEILDEPEFKLTSLLKIPIETKHELTPFITQSLWHNRKLTYECEKPVYALDHHQLAVMASKHAPSKGNSRKHKLS
jgi:hypothetical protein